MMQNPSQSSVPDLQAYYISLANSAGHPVAWLPSDRSELLDLIRAKKFWLAASGKQIPTMDRRDYGWAVPFATEWATT